MRELSGIMGKESKEEYLESCRVRYAGRNREGKSLMIDEVSDAFGWGGSSSGVFLWTLTLTDIHTGWLKRWTSSFTRAVFGRPDTVFDSEVANTMQGRVRSSSRLATWMGAVDLGLTSLEPRPR